jgi:hypothetical protein
MNLLIVFAEFVYRICYLSADHRFSRSDGHLRYPTDILDELSDKEMFDSLLGTARDSERFSARKILRAEEAYETRCVSTCSP